jgi:phosphoribosylformylglycinamidine synthase
MQPRLKSVHDISDGGLLVSVAESCLARGLGAEIEIPVDESNPWQFAFGEGFHGFVVSVADSEAAAFESEWDELSVPFYKLGKVVNQDRLVVQSKGGGGRFTVPVTELRLAWLKEGYWE